MRKKTAGLVCAFIACTTGVTQASPFYTEIIPEESYYKVSPSANATYSFNLNGNVTDTNTQLPLTISSADIITKATVYITFDDYYAYNVDSNGNLTGISDDDPEYMSITVNGTPYLSNVLVNTHGALDTTLVTRIYSFDLAQDLLGTNRNLGIVFSSSEGDYYTYTVGISGDVSPVPLPSTFLLFGTGLAGLTAVGRRRSQR